MNRVISKSKALLSATLLAGIASYSARADYQSTVLSQNPVAYWRLNETTPPPPPGPAVNSGTLGAVDNGVFTGSPPKGLTGALGGSDRAVGFNGSSQWILAPYDANINK